MQSKESQPEYFVSLGFADKPQKEDFEYENFPSKIGGKPVYILSYL